MPKLPADEVERLKEMVPTISELRIIDLMRDYTAIRNARFGNTIPPAGEVLMRFLPRKEMDRLGAEDGVDGLCLHGRYQGRATVKTILLADDMRIAEIRITLLHEMAHLKVNTKFGRNMGHGTHWKKEMRRLAAIGSFDDWW